MARKTNRRLTEEAEALEFLAIRTGEKDGTMLKALLEWAKSYILAYTRRTESEWLPVFDGLARNIAVIEYNRLGAEGFNSRAEGGITTQFHGVRDYPDSVVKTLDAYRLIRLA